MEFSASGDVGRAKITVRQNASVDKEDEQVGLGSGVCLRVHFVLGLLPLPVAIQETGVSGVTSHMSMTQQQTTKMSE